MKTLVKVKSPANIAFIKYWGRRNHKLILPCNSSFSMNLSDCSVTVQIKKIEKDKGSSLFIKEYESDKYIKNTDSAYEKTIKFFQTAQDFLGKKADFDISVKSSITFPRSAGIASSAAYFSALALGFCKLLDVELDKKQLSILARLSGSGSACRSVPDGFVLWHKGNSSESSYAESLADPKFWSLVDVVVIVSDKSKKVASAEGHQAADTSPLFDERVYGVEKRLKLMLKAFENKDLEKFGHLLEAEALSMHSVMMTQRPNLYYWSLETFKLMKSVVKLRESGLPVFFTIDAGANLHLITESRYLSKLKPAIGKYKFIVNRPAFGAKVL
ncbi:MAG: diphosphomevalonate decarboxylase [Patescibacteria group bacterium]|nr:MAG: diphosphomevalonate decarboxylase [Patescibacteria group bacterium]